MRFLLGLFKNKNEREILKINQKAFSMLHLTGLAPDPNDESMQTEYALSISNAYYDGGNVNDAICYYLIKLSDRNLVNSKGDSINSKVREVFDSFVEEAEFCIELKERFSSENIDYDLIEKGLKFFSEQKK